MPIWGLSNNRVQPLPTVLQAWSTQSMDVDGDIWTEFQPLVKRLYEVDRKTLRDVKTILEGQHGFPETP